MRYRAVGRSGLKVSCLSLGGWTTYGESVRDQGLITAIVRRAFEVGVNYFDMADVYGRGEAERRMGQVLGELPRHRLVLSSKVFFPMSDDPNDRGLSRKHIHESIDATLKRLGTDYLDLYFAHRLDPAVRLEEIVRAFSDLVDRGKVLYWGTSEWPPESLTGAVEMARREGLHAPIVEQPQYSLLYRRIERELFPILDDTELGLVVWSPLGQGLLTGKYDGGVAKGSRFDQLPQFTRWLLTEDNLDKTRRMEAVAQDMDSSRAQLALAWVLSRRQIASAIMGATTLQQLEENLAAAELELPPEVVESLDEIFR